MHARIAHAVISRALDRTCSAAKECLHSEPAKECLHSEPTKEGLHSKPALCKTQLLMEVRLQGSQAQSAAAAVLGELGVGH